MLSIKRSAGGDVEFQGRGVEQRVPAVRTSSDFNPTCPLRRQRPPNTIMVRWMALDSRQPY